MPARLNRSLRRLFRSFRTWIGKHADPILLALLVLAGSAVWFAAQSTGNYERAREWETESRAWQARAVETEELLRRSEADVEDLESRQISLAEEKVDLEDQSQIADLVTSKAVLAGTYQARCAESLLELTRRRDREPVWARRNEPIVLAFCERASAYWADFGSVGDQKKTSPEKDR